ncbi:hypothetical protein TorRG33x02_355700, partial [Trema orientale]
KAKGCIDDTLGPTIATPSKWCRPAVGTLKLNANVALFNELGFMGAGIVIRNDRGDVIGAKSSKIMGRFNPLMAELCTIQEGLLFAIEIDVCLNSVENDSVNAVTMLNSPSGLHRRIS